MVNRNIKNTLKRVQTDYVCIGIFENEDSADHYISISSKQYKDYSMYKKGDGEMVVISQ